MLRRLGVASCPLVHAYVELAAEIQPEHAHLLRGMLWLPKPPADGALGKIPGRCKMLRRETSVQRG